MLKYILLFLLFIMPVHIDSMNSDQSVYKIDRDNSYVDNVHYDKNLNVIVVNIHAKIFFLDVDENYGILVKGDSTKIDEELKKLLGGDIQIIHLKKVK